MDYWIRHKMRKNKRKIQALELLKNAWEEKDLEKIAKWGHSYSAISVAFQLGISRNSASNLLRRLWKQGLARRKKKRKEIEYWIMEKGLKRLRFLKKQRIKEKLKRKLGNLAFWRR